MTTPLRIHLFGTFEVCLNGILITHQGWKTQQTRTIFKVLLARRGKVVSSDQMIDIVWPHDDVDAARKRLYVRISQLRHALGAFKSLVQTVDGGYIFNPDEGAWLDVIAFQDAIAKGSHLLDSGRQSEAVVALEEARSLYRGDFLAEDLYADWTLSQREYFRERYISTLTELAECYAQQGRYRLAIARCQEAQSHDPLRESIHVRLMLYHYYAGHRSQSLLVYDRLCASLREELALEPLNTTAKIAEQIRDGTLWANEASPRYPPPVYEGRLFEVPYALSETPFVGRDREYAWLVDTWKDRRNRVILLHGEAGIGKSRLVDEFVGYITSQGATVLRSRIAPGETSPLRPVTSALQPFTQQQRLTALPPTTWAVLSRVFRDITGWTGDLPEIPSLSSEGEQNRLYTALDAFISLIPGERRILVIDDAHRIGEAACELLSHISDALQVLLSYRSEEVPPDHPIRAVFSTPSAELQIKPLATGVVRTLLQRLSGRALPDLVEHIEGQAEGNPLYIVTVLQHMFDQGQLYVDAGGAWCFTHCEETALPQTIHDAIERRLQRLNRHQRRIVDLAAVLGGEFDFELLQQATQEPEEALLTTLDQLIDAALMAEPRREGRAEFAVAHDRYVEVTYATLPDVRRRQLHALAAQAIEQVYQSDINAHYPSLAEHYGKAAMPSQACHYAGLAGEQAAAQFDNQAALRYLSRALELTPVETVDRRSQLLLARERVYDLLGERELQQRDLESLTAMAGALAPGQQAEISLRYAAYLWVIGEVDTAEGYLDETIASAHSSGAAEVEAKALLLKARCRTSEPDVAHAYLAQARSVAQRHHLRVIEGDIVRNMGNLSFWQNEFHRSMRYFRQAQSIHREVGDLRGEVSILNNLGHVSRHLGEQDHARGYFEAGLEICGRIGDRLAEGVLLANLSALLIDLGAYDQAVAQLTRAAELRTSIQNEEGVGSLLPGLGDTLRRQGEFAQARAQLERALEINTRIEHRPQTCLSHDALSIYYRELGDYATAMDHHRRALDALADDEAAPNHVRALANGCLLRHLRGDHAAALAIGERALALSVDLPQIRATALTHLGTALYAVQRYDEARERSQAALALREALQQPHLTPDPLATLAQVELAQGRLAKAKRHVEEILALLGQGFPQGADQPFLVYGVCYRVLAAHQDARAREVLDLAYHHLQHRADQIKDEALRRSYLTQVSAHQEMIHLHDKLSR